jgi:hypothetical protein
LDAGETSFPPDRGPPLSLPSHGNPGQHFTIVNQTNTVYQRWIHEWQEGNVGGKSGDWIQVAYQARACSSGNTSLCQKTPE